MLRSKPFLAFMMLFVSLVLLPLVEAGVTQIDTYKKAIEKAVSISKPGDIIIAAGKGHETYQITNNGTIHFDDKEELTKAAQKFADKFKPIPWTVDDLSKALNTDPYFSTINNNYNFAGISTDSRTILESQIFIALKGESFDGHTFIKTHPFHRTTH